MIGEIWESSETWLQGDMFDSTMNYDFRKHCCAFFAEKRIDAAAFSGRITDMLMRYRLQMLPAQLNLLDSHDVSRFLSLCGGDTLSPLRDGTFQMLSAEEGSRVIRFRRDTGAASVMVCINAGNTATAIPQSGETLYWAEGLQNGILSPGGFSVTYR